MKKFSKSSILTIMVSLVLGLTGATSVFASGSSTFTATTPYLGTNDTFGIMSGTYTNSTNAGLETAITGNVCYTTGPGTAPISISGATTVPCSAPITTVQTSAKANLRAQVLSGCTNLGAGTQNLTGTYTPGCYYSGGDMHIVTGVTVTLNGAGTYIFKPGGALTTEANTVVQLAGGASACDVFWIPVGATTLGANDFTHATSSFVGNIFRADADGTSISLGKFVNLLGRLWATGPSTITTDSNTISVPTGCVASAAPRRRTVSPTPTPIIVPVIGLTKIPSPLSLPGGPGKVTYNYSVWNVSKLQPLIDVTLVDDKCSPIVFVSGDNNANGLLDIDEVWKYSCSSNIVSTTTNTAIATAHSSDGYYNTAIATAITTVVVGSQIQPPLINVVKVPSQLTPLPYGGGDVTYTYTVTNPGVVALNNVSVTDDKCPSVSYVSGDNNYNNLLDTNESWIYTCKQNIKVSTGNVATAKGMANGLTALSYSFVNVLVNVPSLPNTGLGLEGITISWFDIILVIAVIVLSIWLAKVMKKIKKQAKI